MSGGEVAALLTALTTMLGAIFVGVRNLRSDKTKKEVEAAAALLLGYTGMVEVLQTEIGRLKEDHAEDRAAWAAERRDIKIECLEDMARLREEHKSEMLIAYEQMEKRDSQIYVLLNRPPESRERSTDERH